MDNDPEDVRWLSSLSESELDFLISLKKMAIQRARVVGHQSLGHKFDLKMLRALGYILMQHVKGKVNELQLDELNGLNDTWSGCNLLNLNKENRVEMGEEMKMAEQAKTRSTKVTPRSKRRKIDK